MAQTTQLASQITELLSRMTPKMTDEGFKQFNADINKALANVVEDVFSKEELDAFHVDTSKLIHLKRD